MTDPPDLLTGPEDALRALEGRFLEACALAREGKAEEALNAFSAVLRIEPRLAEPRMERARLLLEGGSPEDAEAEVREAIRLLEAGGAWLEDPPEEVLLGMAYALLGEAILRRADTDDMVHGSPGPLAALHGEAADAFRRAVMLDPGNEHARFHAFHLAKRSR